VIKKYKFISYSIMILLTTVILLTFPFLFVDLPEEATYEEYEFPYTTTTQYDFENSDDESYYQYKVRNQNILFIGTNTDDLTKRSYAEVVMLISINTGTKEVSMYQFNPYTLVDDNTITMHDKFALDTQEVDALGNPVLENSQPKMSYSVDRSAEELIKSLRAMIKIPNAQESIPINDYIILSDYSFLKIFEVLGNLSITLDNNYTYYNSEYTKGSQQEFTAQDAMAFIKYESTETTTTSVDRRSNHQRNFVTAFVTQKLFGSFKTEQIYTLYDAMFGTELKSSNSLGRASFNNLLFSIKNYKISKVFKYSNQGTYVDDNDITKGFNTNIDNIQDYIKIVMYSPKAITAE